MIYDKGKIFLGLGLFLLLMTFPIWYNVAKGKARTYKVELEKPRGEACVMPRAYMRPYHMDVLYSWRDEYVREGDMIHKAPHTNKEHVKSLSNGCLSCHVNKDKFCDRCHDYSGVEPYCWDCHVVPKQGR